MLVCNKTINKYYWCDKEIAEAEYNHILDVLRNIPEAPSGYGYRLTIDLEWELYELPPADPDPELSAEEALDIILGGDGA